MADAEPVYEPHEILGAIPLHGIVRIDAGLEGDWSDTVVTVWTRESGPLGFDPVASRHPVHRPSLELYFEGAWVGVHCYRVRSGLNVFDEHLARRIVSFVEAALT